jgi:CheY-like chemotaxis protein
VEPLLSYAKLPSGLEVHHKLVRQGRPDGQLAWIATAQDCIVELLRDLGVLRHLPCRFAKTGPISNKPLIQEKPMADPLGSLTPADDPLIEAENLSEQPGATSLLENHDMEVISTTNGRSAIEIIERTPDLSIVLMDIMMPDMDGYETIGKIRQNAAFSTLPILALTAKAMKGDREKCLNAGASDYIAKPVNTDQLLALMRVWLFR